MLANGPAWMNAGPPSSVWTRLGLIASRMSTAIAPATFSSLERDGLAVEVLGDDAPTQPRAQVVDVGREGEDRHHLRRGGDVPLGFADVGLSPRPIVTRRRARSLTSITRGQRIGCRVDAQGVAAEEVVVQERGAQGCAPRRRHAGHP